MNDYSNNQGKRLKAYTYITQTLQGTKHLLVFTQEGYPGAGVQVPGGSVENGESLEQAALREAQEETGLTDLQILKKVGGQDYLHPEKQQLQERHFFELTSNTLLPESWSHRVNSGSADKGLVFQYFWIPLSEATSLAGEQGVFANHLIEQPKRNYEVAPYDPEWPTIFAKEAELISNVFQSDALAVEHIGSTSVPGMDAKPLIDVLVLVEDITTSYKHAQAMEQAGFAGFGNVLGKGSELFRRESSGVQKTNVHIFQKDHPHVHEMLSLRDYLRTHPDEVAAYSQLKRKLYELHPDDYRSYRREKDVFVKKLTERAITWSRMD